MTRLLPSALLLTALALAAPAPAPAATLDLFADAGLRADGPTLSLAGEDVAGVGDVNGDGAPDVLVGARWASPEGRDRAGAAYVLFGGRGTGTAALDALDPRDGFRIEGAAALDQLGAAVGAAGDVNGDGRDDLVVAAPTADNNERSSSGSVYVVFGTANGGDVDTATLTPRQGFRIDGGVADEPLGTSVAGAGDLNGDGFDDVAIGTIAHDPLGRENAGVVHVVYGSAAPAPVDLAAMPVGRGFRILGPSAGARIAHELDGGHDVNGDGRDDLVVAEQGADHHGRSDAGAAYVVFGRTNPGTVDLASFLPGEGFRIDGAAPGDIAGSAVALTGDVSGDGRADVLLGAPGADRNGRAGSGTAYVVFGRDGSDGVDLAALTPATGRRIDGAAPADGAGSAVAGAGDVDRDGVGDVVVGAFAASNNGRPASGSAYVVLGGQGDADLAVLAPAQGFRADGPEEAANAGSAVAGAGDFDGDGASDVVVGADQARPQGRDRAGSAYVVSSRFLPAVVYDRAVIAEVGRPLSVAPTLLRATRTRTLAIAPALPAGLAFDPATGRISGTPTAHGITRHRVTLTDERGRTATTVELGIVNAQGPAGPRGGDGAAGPKGADGANGANGATAASGANGGRGAPGPAGAPGPSGPAGPAGRDAKVTCRAAKPRKGRTKVTCRVTLARAKAARATLTRAGRVHARGTVSRAGRVTLTSARRLPAGRYTLRLGPTKVTVAVAR